MTQILGENHMMKLEKEIREKLQRYLINADPFLWNVLENKNKVGRVKELKEMGFIVGFPTSTNFTYKKLYQDLLVEVGMEAILDRIVIPRIYKLFTVEQLEYLRRCWEQGQTPSLKYFKDNKLYRKHIFTNNETYDGSDFPVVAGYKEAAFVFVQINNQQNFIERWTVFAGLWFEEIEPFLR
jgi:hypothetical protein